MLEQQNIIEQFFNQPGNFSEDEKVIVGFVHLYQTKPELFPPEVAQLGVTLPDDLNKISDTILDWCDDYASEAYDKLVEFLEGNTKGPGGKKNLNVEQAKELIENAIRKSIPSVPKVPKGS